MATPPSSSERIQLGVAAMDRKARSKPMQNILNRLISTGKFDVTIFGDKVILDEDVDSWPTCDFLISFFSTGFPLDKAIAYMDLQKPICINDLPMQKVLWDRRLVLAILDAINVPTPKRIEVDRDGGPSVDPAVAEDLRKRLGVRLDEPRKETEVKMDGEDAIIVNGKRLEKPFVEKPVSGEDHNIHIYFPKARGGGGRRLFRKASRFLSTPISQWLTAGCATHPSFQVGNKSSSFDPNLTYPRTQGSFIYEQFMDVDNAEDIKVYTIGPSYVHAETRKSPVVDGHVKRNPDGKEIRYITKLTPEEERTASAISKAFKQNVCGFDLLRVGNKSYVIDVNGWSFVKGNDQYYDKAAEILTKFCNSIAPPRTPSISGGSSPRENEKSSWTLKGHVTVFRHADRTPKQKLKCSFKVSELWAAPLIDLLRGHREEVIVRNNLEMVIDAGRKALELSGADAKKLKTLITVLEKKKSLPGTKAQLKPTFSKTTDELEKMQLVIKWGGEFSHAARHQSRELAETMRRDIRIMNEECLKNVRIYSSSERRVTASAEIFASAFLNWRNSPSRKPPSLIVRKDLLDDSNAAKEEMDTVKKKLKKSLKPGAANLIPEGWPSDYSPPVAVAQEIVELMTTLRRVMEDNFERLDVQSIQSRWCCKETPALFKERWTKIFDDFSSEPYDPSRSSELYDTLKYDALHNRTFVEAVFHDPSEKTAPGVSRLHRLFGLSRLLFSYVCVAEYGISHEEKLEIGLLTSLPLLRKIVGDLEEMRDGEQGSCALYFTKESHIHTLLNLLTETLPMAKPHVELDYCAHITFELYERQGGPGVGKELSLLLSLSEGAHASDLIDLSLDARHALTVQPRRKLTHHLPLPPTLDTFKSYFTKRCKPDVPLEEDEAFSQKEVRHEHVLPVPVPIPSDDPLGRRESPSNDSSSSVEAAAARNGTSTGGSGTEPASSASSVSRGMVRYND